MKKFQEAKNPKKPQSAKYPKYKDQKPKLKKVQPKTNYDPVKNQGTKNQEHTTRTHGETMEDTGTGSGEQNRKNWQRQRIREHTDKQSHDWQTRQENTENGGKSHKRRKWKATHDAWGQNRNTN